MKKKVFSKLLMVALVATVGAFTSCKDYDDDINDLRSQINGLETSLKATIDKNASDAANSLAILEKQLADVKVAYADADAALDTQLKTLKNDVSTAMTSLQGGIDANKANIATNLEAINNLKSEVASLKTAVGTLEAAKVSLEKSLKETNDLLKSQGETIATLVQTDQNLEKGINEAKALATKAQEAADAAQRAADKVAADLATLTTQEANDVANLQKQISDNLASLTKKIDDMNAALDARIKTNTQSISDLATKVAENYATIVYVDKQIEAVKAANTKVANDLAAAQTDLEAKIKNCGDAAAKALQEANDAIMKAVKEGNDAQDKALEAAEKRLKDADDKQDAYLAQQLIEINTKIGDVTAKAAATATALDLLQQKEAADIEALSQKHDADLDLFKNQVITEIIPAQVATQVAYYVPKAMQDFFDKIIKPYVDNVDEKHTTLLNNFIERFEADSIKMDAYLAGEYLLAIQALVGDTADVLRDEMALTAQDLKDAYELADNQLKQNLQGQIDDMNNPEKEGSLANLLKTAKENLQGQITTANGKIEAIETFLGKSEEGFSYETLAASIAETEVFGNAIENAVKEAYGEILSMVTSINLYANQHQAQDNNGGYDGFDHSLVFTYIVERANVKFPANETVTDKQLSFEEGMFRSFEDSILVRVSPTNAELTKDQIALFNSQGENVVANKVIEVTAVNRYARPEGQYITRAENTGLWVIKFKIVEDKLGDGFKKAAYDKYNRSILYAVAAKSGETAEDAADRYVVSEYDLNLATADAYPAWDFTVNNVSVANIHNRYIETDQENVKTDITDGIAKLTYKKELTWKGFIINKQTIVESPYTNARTYMTAGNGVDAKKYKEYIAQVPGVTVDESENGNAVDRFGHTTQHTTNGVDNRHMKEILDVNEGEPIKIKFPTYFEGDVNYPVLIKGFYVTLDHDFALESNSSEINSWTSYEYENVGFYKTNHGEITFTQPATLFEGSEGEITVKSLNNVKGDVIGFRVFAVNINGTLYDPDGRAFYVRVGNPYETRNLSYNIYAETNSQNGSIQNNNAEGKNPIIAQNDIFKADETNSEEPFFNVDPAYINNYNFVLTWGKNNPEVYYNGNAVTVAEGQSGYIGDSGSDLIGKLFKFRTTNNNPAAYVYNNYAGWEELKPSYKTQNMSCQLLNSNMLIDGATYNLVLTIYNKANNNGNNSGYANNPGSNSGASIVEKVNISIKKVMPDYLPEAFGVRIAQEEKAANMKFFLRPVGTTQLDGQDSYVKAWSIDSWFDSSNTDKQWGLTNLTNTKNQATKPYRWATDVRPFNFEEIFTGLLLDANGTFDKNYQFVFEGCGEYAEDKANEKAVTEFKKYGNDITYVGLNEYKEPITCNPGYYLPYVYYNVINTYGTNALSVKASYVYRNVSLTTYYENGQKKFKQGDYVSKPIYFDKDGKEVKEAKDAAFKAKFACAIHDKFTFTLTESKPNVTAEGFENVANFGTTIATAVPYGLSFSVTNTDDVTCKMSWISNLAAYTTADATAASYFRTNFNEFTPDYTKVTADGTSYYRANLKSDFNGASSKWANVYRTWQTTETVHHSANWPFLPWDETIYVDHQELLNNLKLVDVQLGNKQLKVDEIIIYKANAVKTKADLKAENVQATLKTAAEIGQYFEVVKNNGYGQTFNFKGTTHLPADLGVFQIKMSSGAISGNILHQWGHKQAASATSTCEIFFNRPDADPNLQGARQTR